MPIKPSVLGHAHRVIIRGCFHLGHALLVDRRCTRVVARLRREIRRVAQIRDAAEEFLQHAVGGAGGVAGLFCRRWVLV